MFLPDNKIEVTPGILLEAGASWGIFSAVSVWFFPIDRKRLFWPATRGYIFYSYMFSG